MSTKTMFLNDISRPTTESPEEFIALAGKIEKRK